MNQRCLTILDLLNREETLDVNDLAERLNVSAVTVRKDLAILENKGLLHRQRMISLRLRESQERAESSNRLK
ncbi:MAG: DeoR/GlpR transcriptional regulator, partial [Clostridia bacterium]|nr:DeoR/GlpR transcriptional regulator [Clostridia bacterium]